MDKTAAARGKAAYDAGAAFEQRVVRAYNLLGYSVQHNMNLSSSQTDLVCTKETPGATLTRLYVECKFRSGKAVSKPEVMNILATFETLRERHRLTCAVVVADSGFSAEAKDIVSNRLDVRLITEKELTDELLNVSFALHRLIERYETQAIYSSFVPLHAADNGQDLIQRSIDWLAESTRLLVVLGDFGSGKTTLARRLNYVLAKEYLVNQIARIPLYLELRDYMRFPSVQSFIESKLLNEFKTSDYLSFRRMLEDDRLLLIMDGFDEIGAQIDAATRQKAFSDLTSLFHRGSKTIITCRPGYFVTDEEMQKMFTFMQDYLSTGIMTEQTGDHRAENPLDNFIRAATEWTPTPSIPQPIRAVHVTYSHIAPFSETDIIAYLHNQSTEIEKAGRTPQQILNKLKTTYDLMDLGKRPILLALLVSSLPMIPESIEPSPFVIYDTYTNIWLDVEYSKGEVRWLINRARKLLFMTELAHLMYRQGKTQIHYSELPNTIREHFSIDSVAQLAHFATDILGCSFLRRDRDGNFEFIHKSFGEFFMAVYVYERCKKGTLECLEKVRLSPEVLFFLGDIAYNKRDLKAHLQRMARTFKEAQPSAVLTDNVIGALACSRGIVSATEWENISLPLLQVIQCELQNVKVKTTSATERTTLDRCKVSDTVIRSSGTQLTFANCQCDGVSVEAGYVLFGREGVVCHSGSMKNSSFTFDKCRIRFDGGFKGDRVSVLGSLKTLLDSVIESDVGVFEPGSTSLKACTIMNCRLGSYGNVDVDDCWWLGVLVFSDVIPKFLEEGSTLYFASVEKAIEEHEDTLKLVKRLRRQYLRLPDLRIAVMDLPRSDHLRLLWGLQIVPDFSPDDQNTMIERIAARIYAAPRPGKGVGPGR